MSQYLVFIRYTKTRSDGVIIVYIRTTLFENITKTSLYNFDPLKPHVYIIKLGFTGYSLFFLFLVKKKIMLLTADYVILYTVEYIDAQQKTLLRLC